MSVSSRSHAAEQKFDNRKRQRDGDDHHHHAARRDYWLQFAFDDGRRYDLNVIDPARGNGGCGGSISIQRSTHGVCTGSSLGNIFDIESYHLG